MHTRNLWFPGSHKLAPRWVGPFVITSRVGASAYRLDLKGKYTRLHPVFHVSLLKKHMPGGSSPSPPDPVEIDGEVEFVVEKIVGHRSRRSGI